MTASTSKPNVVNDLAFELDSTVEYVGSYTDSLTAAAASDVMEMMTYIASADVATAGDGAAAGINFGYYTTSGTNNVHFVQQQFGKNIDYWRVYKISASIPASQAKGTPSRTYSQAEIFEAIGGSATKFKMTASRADENSRAKFYQGASTKAAPTAPGQSADLIFATDLSFAQASGSIVGYLGIYIEGNGTNDNNTAPSGAFTVTIAKAG